MRPISAALDIAFKPLRVLTLCTRWHEISAALGIAQNPPCIILPPKARRERKMRIFAFVIPQSSRPQMPESTLHIKHMVCPRCVLVVQQVLTAAGHTPVSVALGQATLPAPISAAERADISQRLEAVGFQLIDDAASLLADATKRAIISYVRSEDAAVQRRKLSDHLADTFRRDYSAIAANFSDIENVTIEQYCIAQRIEYVKELLVYGELSLSEIAYRLGYSSVAYLSAQFKRTTGFTPTAFKQIKGEKRLPIDKI